MTFKNKRIMIVGEGISGNGAFAALESLGADCFYYDSGFDYDPKLELIVVSPGVPLTHRCFKIAKERGIELIGEIELGFILCKKPIVAVTGTNGKTTTTELIGNILTYAKRKPLVCGNIGTAFSSAVLSEEHDIVVLEVSSFQLETIKKFWPHIAVLTNITEDHLDRHKTMKKYAAAKLNIAKNQTKDDYFIMPEGGISSDYLKTFKPKSEIITTGTGQEANGCYMIGKKIFYKGSMIAMRSDIRMQGAHNVSNALLAMTACKLLGASDQAIRTACKLYDPRIYRITFAGEAHGKSYYNDSKGTNIDACIKACETMDGATCLIAGGSDKGYNFEKMFINLPENIKHIIAIGETAAKIKESAIKTGYPNFTIADSLKDAVISASKLEVKNVLLSPATASFDMYKNYEERGRDFDTIVQELK